MPLPLFENLPSIRDRVAAVTDLLLFLDYDGTLTPIVERPVDAWLETTTRGIIAGLARNPHIRVAILSGRAIDDLQTRVGIRDLIYAGNHGLEMRGPGFSFNRTAADEVQKVLLPLADVLREQLRNIPGIIIENKMLTLSVHYRLTPAAIARNVLDVIVRCMAGIADDFQVMKGLMVFEILPNVDWNKSAAAQWIKNTFAHEKSLTICLGDDRTDEDAFLVLDDGITINVGDASETWADYQLSKPADVRRFLEWLSECALATPTSNEATFSKG